MLVINDNSLKADTQTYFSPLSQAEWRLTIRPELCRLNHRINEFGQVSFSQQLGETLEFTLRVSRPMRLLAPFQLQSVAPAWKQTPTEFLGKSQFNAGLEVIQWANAMTERLFIELQFGMMPEFVYVDAIDQKDRIYVNVSPVGFRKHIANFLDCIETLESQGPVSLLQNFVYFDTDSELLNESDRFRLAAMAENFISSPGDKRIQIFGHADERGTHPYNSNLSRRRAQTVRYELINMGVPFERIQLNYFGEQEPFDRRSTSDAWAKNRRVKVVLSSH